MRVRARRPQVRALKRTAVLPSAVFGPVDCWAFCRLACCCLSEITIRKFLLGLRGSGPHTRLHDRARMVRKGRIREGAERVSVLVSEGCDGGDLLCWRVTVCMCARVGASLTSCALLKEA